MVDQEYVEAVFHKTKPYLVDCIETNNPERLSLLLKAGFPIDEWIVWPTTTLLMFCASNGNKECI